MSVNDWGNFFLAEAGASAALAGLVFVGISINIARIVQFPSLPDRALEALVALLELLIMASFALVPGQSVALFGGEVLPVALVAWTIVIVLGVRSYRAVSAQYRPNQVVHITLAQAATLPFIAAGIILLSGSSSGLYLVVPGTIFAYVVAVFNAWVLLIEINR